MLKIVIVICLVVVILPVTWFVLSFFYPDLLLRPAPSGLCEGRLANKPNWVSSKVSKSDPHYIPPLPQTDKAELIDCINTLPPKRVNIEQVGEDMHGVRRTSFFGFADWFCITSDGDITSSATIGHSDMGVNRAWVTSLRKCLMKRQVHLALSDSS